MIGSKKSIKLFRITTVPISLLMLLTGQMRFMKSHGYSVVAISAAGSEITDVILNEGVYHKVCPFTRTITPLKDLKCLIGLIKYFMIEKPDIVHTHTPKAGLLGMLAAKIARVPVRIHTVAGLPLMTASGGKKKLLETVEKLTYWGAQKVWPNSQSIYDYMIENKLCNESKMKIIGKGSSNGIDLNKFSSSKLDRNRLDKLKSELKMDTETTYLLAVGRIVVDKGILELIDAFVQLKSRYTNIKLILLGPIEKERTEESLPDYVLDRMNNDLDIIHISWSNEVEYYMELADLLVHASHREGFPNVVLQAGAMRLPIVCSEIPGNVDIVEHKHTGYLFKKGSRDELLEGICWVLDHAEDVKLQTNRLRKQIEKMYDRKVFHQLILDEYTNLLSMRQT